MPRFGVVWVVSVLLQAAGVIWIIACTFLLFLVKPFGLAPSQDALWELGTDAYLTLVNLANVTTFTAISGYVLSLVIGLLAVGQGLIVLMAIERNSRRRPRE